MDRRLQYPVDLYTGVVAVLKHSDVAPAEFVVHCDEDLGPAVGKSAEGDVGQRGLLLAA